MEPVSGAPVDRWLAGGWLVWASDEAAFGLRFHAMAVHTQRLHVGIQVVATTKKSERVINPNQRGPEPTKTAGAGRPPLPVDCSAQALCSTVAAAHADASPGSGRPVPLRAERACAGGAAGPARCGVLPTFDAGAGQAHRLLADGRARHGDGGHLWELTGVDDLRPDDDIVEDALRDAVSFVGVKRFGHHVSSC